MLHLTRTHSGAIKDCRDGVPLADAQLKDEFNPCGALDPHPEHLRGDDTHLTCTMSGRKHAGAHKAFGFGNRLYEWANEASA
jgi:hypothetical protein